MDDGSKSASAIGERASLAELFERLARDLQALVRAEFALYRAEAGRRALSAGWAVGLIIVAVTLMQGALVALLVGLVLLLAPLLGTGWAILAVTAGALAIAGVLIWFGWRNASRMIDPDRP